LSRVFWSAFNAVPWTRSGTATRAPLGPSSAIFSIDEPFFAATDSERVFASALFDLFCASSAASRSVRVFFSSASAAAEPFGFVFA